MIKREITNFYSIHVEGGFFASDFLAKASVLLASNQAESDYNLSSGVKLRDYLHRKWRIASALNYAYNEGGSSENFLKSFLTDVLDFSGLKYNTHPQIKNEYEYNVTYFFNDNKLSLLLINKDQELDKSYVEYGSGNNRKRSPSSCMQEWLNSSDEHLWGIVTNGKTWRLLRDNPSLARQSYLEVNLDEIFDKDNFAEFSLFWLLLHSSRFKGQKASDSIIEKWKKQSFEDGERALENLRNGVGAALRLLGQGFIAHQSNDELRKKIAKGDFDAQAFYEQLLRLIYRFIFLFKTEDRGILQLSSASEDVKELYRVGYSVSKLRDRSSKIQSYDKHHDLWIGLTVLFDFLNSGSTDLALPKLGGLFKPAHCSELVRSSISNSYLLSAIEKLTFFRKDGALVKINYRDMDTEELGSVYESLLELIPQIDQSSMPWTFKFIGDDIDDASGNGSQRKLTGSYYTPDVLVSQILKTSLLPKINQIISTSHDPITDLLKLKICDPACGSGHFLLAAARRVANAICQIKHPEGYSVPEYKSVLRDVIANCIYGVDLNPMAVELCKTGLWLESYNRDKPLSFLDSHIQCGNALVGILNKKVLSKGIPNEAFDQMTGDEKAICTELKRLNRMNSNFENLLAQPPLQLEQDLSRDEDSNSIIEKEEKWESYKSEVVEKTLKESLFVSAFFSTKNRDLKDHIPLNNDLINLFHGVDIEKKKKEYILSLANRYNFFHWRYRFPDVFFRPNDGFDLVIGNPPWEKIKLQEKEFFSSLHKGVASASNASNRGNLIANLKNGEPWERVIFNKFQDAKIASEATSSFVRNSGQFPLTGKGDINLYAIFSELFIELAGKDGRVGIIVPTGIATDDTTKDFFAHIATGGMLDSLYDFENREEIFKGVHRSYKFSLLTIGHNIAKSDLLFFATKLEHLEDNRRHFSLSSDELILLNPNTRTCPVFRSQKDSEITKKIYRNLPILWDERTNQNPWEVSFSRMFDMANDSSLFFTYKDLKSEGGKLDNNIFDINGVRYLPLYEAKMIHHFTYKWSTYEEDGVNVRDCTLDEKSDPNYFPLPRYWVIEKEVVLRAAGAPQKLCQAYRKDDDVKILKFLTQWFESSNLKIFDQHTEIIARADVDLSLSNDYPLTRDELNHLKQLFKKSDMDLTPELKAYGYDLICSRKPKYLVGWRDITNATNERTLISSFLPFCATGDTLLLVNSPYFKDERYMLAFLSILTSLGIDYVARQKIGGTHMKYFTFKQLPTIPPTLFTDIDLDFIQMQMSKACNSLLAQDFISLEILIAKKIGIEIDEFKFMLDPSMIDPDYPSETFKALKKYEILKWGSFKLAEDIIKEFSNE